MEEDGIMKSPEQNEQEGESTSIEEDTSSNQGNPLGNMLRKQMIEDGIINPSEGNPQEGTSTLIQDDHSTSDERPRRNQKKKKKHQR